MSAWTDRILQQFPVELSRFWIACDPDSVLLDEHVLQSLRDRGFELVSFEDPMAFRAYYEDRYRPAWGAQQKAPTDALILHLSSADSDALPWDYLRQARLVRLGLADLFDKLSYSVLREVAPEYYERLFGAHQAHASQVLGDAGTKDFVLTHVFKIVPFLLDDEIAFWREVLRLHLRGETLPFTLAERIAATLQSKPKLAKLPAMRLFEDRAFALRTVQDAWKTYLNSADASAAHEDGRGAVNDGQFAIRRYR